MTAPGAAAPRWAAAAVVLLHLLVVGALWWAWQAPRLRLAKEPVAWLRLGPQPPVAAPEPPQIQPRAVPRARTAAPPAPHRPPAAPNTPAAPIRPPPRAAPRPAEPQVQAQAQAHAITLPAAPAEPRPQAATAAAAGADSAVPLLDTDATRRAVREAARAESIAERAARASSAPPRLGAGERLGQQVQQSALGDCLKGEYAGAGMGLLSLPALLVAEVRGQCRR